MQIQLTKKELNQLTEDEFYSEAYADFAKDRVWFWEYGVSWSICEAKSFVKEKYSN